MFRIVISKSAGKHALKYFKARKHKAIFASVPSGEILKTSIRPCAASRTAHLPNPARALRYFKAGKRTLKYSKAGKRLVRVSVGRRGPVFFKLMIPSRAAARDKREFSKPGLGRVSRCNLKTPCFSYYFEHPPADPRFRASNTQWIRPGVEGNFV